MIHGFNLELLTSYPSSDAGTRRLKARSLLDEKGGGEKGKATKPFRS
jgi:hypothetical protein